MEKYEVWLRRVKDKNLLEELKNMTEEQVSSAFFKDLEFGTAGMRGIVGAGSNCMNIYTVGKVTEAVARYLEKRENPKIAISYDSRNMSPEFAKNISRICAHHGITVYLAKHMMPTPFLSYMVRYYGCDLGIMITASHNPKEYNGYKLYDENGCQLLDEPSKEIMAIAETVDMFNVKTACLKNAVKNGLVIYTDSDVEENYYKEVLSQSINKVENLKVVYTALNGTGACTVPEVLKRQGVDVVLNKPQCKADKNFTTCPYPNPEKKEVFALSEEIANKCSADLIVATDPDSDRVGVEVKCEDGYHHLTGNEVGALLTEYLLSQKDQKGYVVRSLVSTSLSDKIAAKYNREMKVVLTGFKFIGDFIRQLEMQGREKEYILGFEESFGYLIGTYVRDKDATVASMLICEMASYYKKRGKTLVQKLSELYDEFGLYEHRVKSYRFEGKSGSEKMQELLASLRNNPFVKVADFDVAKVTDYMQDGTGLPKADVLAFELSNGGSIIVRPSGTEPLIKVYLTFSENKEANAKAFAACEAFLADYFA